MLLSCLTYITVEKLFLALEAKGHQNLALTAVGAVSSPSSRPRLCAESSALAHHTTKPQLKHGGFCDTIRQRKHPCI